MIHYIKGVVTDSYGGMIVLEANGIGYEINVPANSPAYLKAGTGETVCIYTAMMVREDDVSLYGFADRDSLAMFRMLLTVSGVGGKAALAILSSMTLRQLVQAIAYGDDASITKAPGVGKKTAQRVVIDLKDKVKVFESLATDISAPQPEKGSNREAAAKALMALGFSRTEAMESMAAVPEGDYSTEEYVRLALRARNQR
jgi:Holliday junction DNA helicase RuvA